jgi:hypothetical protein
VRNHFRPGTAAHRSIDCEHAVKHESQHQLIQKEPAGS